MNIKDRYMRHLTLQPTEKFSLSDVRRPAGNTDSVQVAPGLLVRMSRSTPSAIADSAIRSVTHLVLARLRGFAKSG